ncbi:hypothetical protein LEP1GSC196_0040 [Leptospira meyeri serovar Semaranga str. Veldrot Semarang 173]|nr:hypothetical protein LEP1GSC196_0040 [Leptospira meyeri serovar Semaranga str. Veldrot Semarang 173]
MNPKEHNCAYLSEKFVKNTKKLAKNEQWFFMHPTFPKSSIRKGKIHDPTLR